MSPTPSDFILNKNDINDFDGLLCASNIDFIPEVHISCHLCSTWIRMGDGIRGSLKVDQCNMEIQNISIGVLQHEHHLRTFSCCNTPMEIQNISIGVLQHEKVRR